MQRAEGVDGERPHRIVGGVGHEGARGEVEEHVRRRRRDGAGHRRGVADVEDAQRRRAEPAGGQRRTPLGAVDGAVQLGAPRQQQRAEVSPGEAVETGDERPHAPRPRVAAHPPVRP